MPQVVKKIYHWTEICPSSYPALYPDMLSEEGFPVPTVCQLKGQGNKGVTGVNAELRTVQFDIDFCVYKLGTQLKRFKPEEKRELLMAWLERLELEQADKKKGQHLNR